MQMLQDHTSVVYGLAFSADGTLLASSTRDGSLLLHGLDGSSFAPLDPSRKRGAIYGVAFHPDQPTLAMGGEHGWSCLRFDEEAFSWLPFGPSMVTPTTDVAFLDRHTLAVGLGDRLHPTAGRFELWDMRSGRRLTPSFPEPNGVRAVAASPRRKTVAWASSHRMVSVWDMQKQDPVKFPQPGNCLAVALSPDAATLAVAGDWVVRLYDVERKREKAVLKAHKGQVPALAFSPDGRTLVTGSWDQTVRLWDAETGKEREIYDWPVGRVIRLTYSPSGDRLAAGGDTGTIVLWDME